MKTLKIFLILSINFISWNTYAQSSFTISGSAYSYSDSCYRLTPDSTYKVGSVWSTNKVSLLNSFDIFATVYFGNKDVDGADGITFSLQPVSNTVGNPGEGMGMQGVSPSFFAEFDTYQNGNLFDPSYDHVAIFKNGVVDHSSLNNLAGPDSILSYSDNVEDGYSHLLHIKWNANTNTFEVYVDCSLRVSYTGNIVNTIFGGTPDVYWGLTGSTGGMSNLQNFCFLFIYFTSEKRYDELKCLSQEPDGSIRLSWEDPLKDTSITFNYYKILGAQTYGGTYDTLQTIYNEDSLTTIIPPGSGYKHFSIWCNGGLCDFMSRPSDTLSLMELTLNALPPGSAQFAQLSWTPLRTPLLPSTTGKYEIWRETPSGSGNWSEVGETTSLNYTDTVQVCSQMVSYQIRVSDTANNCQSTSTIDSALFTDQTNNDKVVMDSVSVNLAGNAIVSWEPSPNNDIAAYYLYFNDPKLGWVIVDTIPQNTPLPWEWSDSQADSRSEEFKVVSVDSCGNQSDDQVVKSHKTIFMSNYLNKCEAYSRISWSPYKGFDPAGYRLENQISFNGNTSPWTVIYAGGPNDTSYTQKHLQSGYEYCYRVRAFDSTGRSSTSNILCIQAEVPRKSKVLYLAQVTNNIDRGALEINTYVDEKADVKNFRIERAPDREGPYEEIGTVGKPTTSPFTINFIDYGANPKLYHYYYKVVAIDSCGGLDTISNLGRNILLNVKPRADLTNYLTWNPYQEWDGQVARYEIYRKAENENGFNLVGSTKGNDTNYIDDISSYRDTRGGFCYYVKAVEGKNADYTDANGLSYSSRSNEACTNQHARVYIPTAFRPGSYVQANRLFGPSMKFGDVSQYHFYIMNRWGVKVFDTDEPGKKWDGTFQGEDVPEGVYIYFVRYATPGEKPVDEKGSFTLLR